MFKCSPDFEVGVVVKSNNQFRGEFKSLSMSQETRLSCA